MKRFALAFLLAVAGYGVAAVAAYFLIGSFASNVHDRELEAAMTSVFVFGPLGGVIAFVVAFVRLGRSPANTPGA